jgi:hypothetical protein
MDTHKIFDIEKINLIIRLANAVIEKTGSYRFTSALTEAEEVEIKKHFNVEYLYSIDKNHVYILKAK